MKTNILLARLLTLLSLCLLPLWASADSAPEKLIRKTADEVLAIIKANQTEYKQDPAMMYAMVDEKVLPHFDFERMTNLALGRYRKKVKADQKDKLVKAFRELLVRTYGKALLEYNDEQIVFLPLRGKVESGEVTIRSEVEQKGGFPIPINYDMYDKDGDWKVYDISIDNISLVTNYRSTFAKEIKTNGVDSLIRTLQSKNLEQKG